MNNKLRTCIKFLFFTLTLTTLANSALAEQQDNTPDYRNRTIYFIVTDRFNVYGAPYVDSRYPDATNTAVNCFYATGCTEAQWRSYWGGNVQGIIHKLGYLQDMGISALWLTPLMENVPGYEQAGWGTGYHGYWVQNPYHVNPYFGTWNDIDDLSRHLHQAGMSYIQDITLNHSNPSDSHAHGRLYDAKGNVLVDSYQSDAALSKNNQMYKHFEDTKECEAAQQISDYDWNYWQLHHCLLAKLSGYNQKNPAMADYLDNGYKTWITHGADSLRLDVVKFVDPDFLANFNHMVTDYSKSLGHPATYIVGEWSNGGVGDSKSLTFANSYNRYLTNILDFQLSYRLNRFVGGNYEAPQEQMSATQLGQFLSQRVIAFNGRDTWQGAFLDNHDELRTMVRLEKLNVTSEAERRERMDLGTVLLMTVPGIPIIFYGDEQYLAEYNDHHTIAPENVNSANDDPYNRAGMKNWSEHTSQFKIIQALAQLRKVSPAIAKGSYTTLYADQDILVFLRKYQNDNVLVAVNRGNSSKNITLKLNDVPALSKLSNKSYNNLLQSTSNANLNDTFQVSGGNASLHLNNLSSLVIRF